jgi:hypothetical protein
MTDRTGLDRIFKPSEEIVAREIEGELIIVPLTAGIGDIEDELFTFNAPGRAIWKRLDGRISLRAIVGELETEFEGTPGEIEEDVLGLVEELVKRRIVVEVV